MKAIHKLFFLLLAIGYFCTACEPTGTMLTKIHPDGSCSRELSKKVSINNMKDYSTLHFFALLDSTWQIRWKFIGEDSAYHTHFPLTEKQLDSIAADTASAKTKIELIAKKEYHSVTEMSETFNYCEEIAPLKPKYDFQKKFRWFYTYYYYKEVFSKLQIDYPVSIEKYMTKDEASFWLKGTPNLTTGMTGMEMRDYVGVLENKYNEWLGDNYRTFIWHEIAANYDIIKNPPVSKERFIELIDSVLPLQKISMENLMEFSDNKQLEKTLNGYFKTNAFSVLWQKKESVMQKSEEKIFDMITPALFSNKIEYNLLIPGKVLNTSALIMSGDTLKWQLETTKMITDDYILEAQSRKSNVWAFVITGLFILLTFSGIVHNYRK